MPLAPCSGRSLGSWGALAPLCCPLVCPLLGASRTGAAEAARTQEGAERSGALAAFSQAGNCSLGKGCSSRWFLPSFLPHGLFQEVVSDSVFF